MKLLKILAISTLAFLIGIGARVVIRTVSPSLYAKIWGLPAADLLTQKIPPEPRLQPKPSLAAPGDLAVNPLSVSSRMPANSTKSSDQPPALELTGILRFGDRVIAVMSDGSVRTDEDNVPGRPARLTYLTRTFIEWDGQRYWLKPKSLSAQVATESARSNAQPEGPRAQTGGPGAGPSFR